MYQTNQNKRSLRSSLLLGAATVATIGIAAPAMAADSGVETVVVTGSRIPQQGLYSSSPVTAVGQQEMKFEGTTNVENLLNNLPAAFASYGDNLANGATGTATVNLRNLGSTRTLVLVDGKRLMPGDVKFPAPDLNQIPAALVDHVEVSTGGASAVYGSDAVAGVVNFIMRKDFEGVEIDGNYSINQHNNNNGTAAFAITHAGFPVAGSPSSVLDGANVDGTLLMGVNSANGKGNVTLYAGFRNTQAVLESERDFSACQMNDTGLFGGAGKFICSGSSNSAFGNLRSENSQTVFVNAKKKAFSYPGPDGVFGTADDVPTLTGVAFRAAPGGSDVAEGYLSSRDNYNFAPLNYLQRPDTRYTAGAMGHYEISKMADVYTSFMFMDDHTIAQIAPSGFFRGTAPFNGNMHVNCDNPFLGGPAAPLLTTPTSTSPTNWRSILCGPATGLGPTADASVQIGRRLVENGNRQDNLRHTAYRIMWGVKGDLGDGWTYDAFMQYGTTIYAEEYLNEMSVSKAQKALEVVTVAGVPTCKSTIDGSDPACKPLDIFAIGGPSAAALAYIRANGFQQGATEERVVGANLTGDLGQWGGQSPWAKSPVAVSFGVEYRSEFLDDRADSQFETGDLSGQGGPRHSVHGGFNVSEMFGEVRVPVIQDMPFVEDFTLNGGYRYSSYNTAGKDDSYKYGAEWQPIDDIRFRGSFQRAVRAPNVIELFAANSIGLWGGKDPCGTGAGVGGQAAFTPAACANTNEYVGGVFNGGTPVSMGGNYGNSSLDCPAGQCSALFGGNTGLKPESSDTHSLGLVFTPTFFDGFTATIDYFNIKVSNLIGIIPESVIISGCAASNATFLCSKIHRAPGSGIIFGTTAGFIDDRNINTGYLQNRGVDFEANYASDLSDWGMGDNGGIALNFVGTWTEQYKFEPIDTVTAIAASLTPPYNADCAGKFGNVCGTPTPRWRHKLRVTWNSPWDFDLSVAWRYMSRVSLDLNTGDPLNPISHGANLLNGLCGGPCGLTSEATIPAYNYFDLAGTWTVHEGVELHAGVNNVFDKDPPILDGSYIAAPPFGNGNTFPQVYDSMGRFIFVGASIKY